MSQRLENKNIVVTAAGQGIGRATAIAFYKQGAKVIATDLNEKTLASLNKEYKDIEIQKLDSTDYKAIKLFANKIKNIDIPSIPNLKFIYLFFKSVCIFVQKISSP